VRGYSFFLLPGAGRRHFARVERSLYERANGYSYDAVKIFMPAGAKKPVYAPCVEHMPPDVTACIFWMKNRMPGRWHGNPVRVALM
jgi:hypothetical protein